MKLTREQVAIQQLNSAIWMYAYDFDPVAVHTIVGAAYELYNQTLKQGKMNEGIRQNLKPERIKDYFNAINIPYNFFKHGGRKEAKIEIDYDPESVEGLLACAAEANIDGNPDNVLCCAKVYMQHFSLRHPDLLIDGPYKDAANELLAEAMQHHIDVKSKYELRKQLEDCPNPLTIGY